MTIQTKLDRVGILGSTLCAIHCALTPFLVSAGGSLLFLGSAGWHTAFVVFTLVFAVAAILEGHRRHRRYWAMAPLVLAMALASAIGVYHEALEVMPLLHGLTYGVLGTLLVGAHVLNLKLAHGHMHDSQCHHKD